MSVADWLGSLGVMLILLAYFLNAIGRLGSRDLLFILLNLIGASIACYASILIAYFPFVILEGIWALIASYSLFNYLKRSKNETS